MSVSSPPSLSEACRIYLKLGCLSFGGPAAQIALMHRLFVEERQWLREKQFLNALSFCLLLPGPEAMQLATYVGWRLHGVRGGLCAGLAFIIPGAFVIGLLATLYVFYGQFLWLEGVFLGVKSAVIMIVIHALLRVAKTALAGALSWAIALMAFVALFCFDVPYPLIIMAAGLIGTWALSKQPPPPTSFTLPPLSHKVKQACLWVGLWLAPLAFLIIIDAKFLQEIAQFFALLAMVTFGGAYAVLAYMAEEAVFSYEWLTTAQMIDGLGLAETTPGPLILVTQFVGFLAGFGAGGMMLALGTSLLVLWMTFVPCFMWIFIGAPYIDWLASRPRLVGALAGITAAIVGVILSLSVWFGLHVFFAEVTVMRWQGITIWQPEWMSFDSGALVVALVAGWGLLVRHYNVITVLFLCAILGMIVRLLFGS